MKQRWRPSRLARWLTRAPDWCLAWHDQTLQLELAGQRHRIDLGAGAPPQLIRGVYWSRLQVFDEHGLSWTVTGLAPTAAQRLQQTLQRALTLAESVKQLRQQRELISHWLQLKQHQQAAARQAARWLTRDMAISLEQLRPPIDAAAMSQQLQCPQVQQRLGSEHAVIQRLLLAYQADFHREWSHLNAAHTVREMAAHADIFARIEQRPLTDEQMRAVVCFDNRVLLVAAAGSGKTSTMVAKAVYALHRGWLQAEQILLLAFNKQAAAELSQRAGAAMRRLGMQDTRLEAATFHALGLRIITEASGHRPSVPAWALDPVAGMQQLQVVIDELKDHSPTFRHDYDLFRLVYGRDTGGLEPSVEPAQHAPVMSRRVLCLDGQWVGNREEAMIANWLFYNGVEYRYAQKYRHPEVDSLQQVYVSGFYYPQLDLYHEHYSYQAESVDSINAKRDWHRSIHQRHGTQLLLTDTHQLRNAKLFDQLAAELSRQGLTLDPNPDREIPRSGCQPMAPSELLGLLRSFISHVKNHRMTIPELQQRLREPTSVPGYDRTALFVRLAVPVLAAWDHALAAVGGIDFEDMLNLASAYIESGEYNPSWQLVMADEFQDTSRARAALCRALVNAPHRHFFAVGDDWQSINRFAGADVSVMTDFDAWFGLSQQLRLERTFRCPQELCDIAGEFVSKNPAQLRKQVRSTTPAQGPVLQAFEVEHAGQLADAIRVYLDHLLAQAQVPMAHSPKASVCILGRYQAERRYLDCVASRHRACFEVMFMTIHAAKGSEADYVLLPEMLSSPRRAGFPSLRGDDPVLGLAMPGVDAYPHAEERRLFYVALTRARRGVTMFTVRGSRSSFLKELKAAGRLEIGDLSGAPIQERPCPACQDGVIVSKHGPHGMFQACSNYPLCNHKPRHGAGAPPA